MSLQDRIDLLVNRYNACLLPPSNFTVSEWSDKNRYLRSTTSAEPGRWRTARFPFIKEIMDCLSTNSPVQDISFMKGAQVGGTDSACCWLGYVIDQEPGPAMAVQPSVDLAKRFSRTRVAPMISDSPALAAKVKESRSRDSGNTLLSKEFPGGILLMTGANSAAGLRSTPVRYLMLDEVDAYPDDVEGEGDPVDLAMARTRNFSSRKVLKISTSLIKGTSRIEADYLDSDQRKYFVPCPACNHMHVLTWDHFIIPADETGKKLPRNAHMVCPECGTVINEHSKPWMLEHGEWRPTNPGYSNPQKRGYHISSLYSPIGFFSWADIADLWLKAQKDPKRLKTFTNTVLGETFEEATEVIEAEELMKRRQRYDCEVPNDVLVLTCAVDTQGNRLEYEVVGWGLEFESWGIEYGVIMGDPGQKFVWDELDKILNKTFTQADGQRLQIMTTCVDSGGHHTKEVYKFCRARELKRVWAIKGQGGSGIPFINRPKRRNPAKVWLFIIGVDVGKDTITSRLKMLEEGPGYCHFPIDRNAKYDLAYFEGLTSEHRKIYYAKGRPTIHWEKRHSSDRNEPFDLRNYATAAVEILNPNLEALAQMAQKVADRSTNKQKAPRKRRVLSSGVSV